MDDSDRLLVRFITRRDLRDRLRDERDSLYCERAEPVTQIDPATDLPIQPTQEQPCWKMARKFRDNDSYRAAMYFDPPEAEWCSNCRRREDVTADLRDAVRSHAGALRGLIRRGKSLAAKGI